MKVDLQKELKSTSRDQMAGIQKFNDMEEVKLLLEHNSAQERGVLRNFQLDDSLVRVERERGKLIEVEDFTKEYGNAYHIDAVRALAIKYRMRFLPLNMYKGAIDPLLANALLKFGKEHNVDPTHPGTQDMFYVLAPTEDFRLTTEVNTIIVRNIVSVDPLLFYRGSTKDNDNREGKLWTLVHKWGTDFNYTRLFRAVPFRNAKNLWMANALAYASLAFLLITAIFSTYSMNMLTLVAISAAIGCIGSCIRSSNFTPTDEKNMFSEHNWSDDRYHVDKIEVVTEYRNRF